MSNSLDPDQARRFVGPDLGSNCLSRLSADDTGRQRVKASYQLLKLCSSVCVGPQACFLVTRPVLFTALSPPQRGIFCFECDAQDSPDTCRDVVMCDFDHVSKPFYRNYVITKTKP